MSPFPLAGFLTSPFSFSSKGEFTTSFVGASVLLEYFLSLAIIQTSTAKGFHLNLITFHFSYKKCGGYDRIDVNREP